MSDPETNGGATEPDMVAMPMNDDVGEWPTHGGPLGCLISIVFGCLLAGFFASPLIQGAYRPSHGYAPWFVIVGLLIMVGGLIGFAVIGWRLGKRFFREYPLPERRAAKREETVI